MQVPPDSDTARRVPPDTVLQVHLDVVQAVLRIEMVELLDTDQEEVLRIVLGRILRTDLVALHTAARVGLLVEHERQNIQSLALVPGR